MRLADILLSLCAAQGLVSALEDRDNQQRSLDDVSLEVGVPHSAAYPQQIEASSDLKWFPCYNVFQCARYETPLDYNNPDGPRANVPLVKYPAAQNSTQGPYQGMVLLNPGGPGGSGINQLMLPGAGSGAQSLQNIIGSNYDVISFDPRGVGYANPSANCSSIDTNGRPQSPLSKRARTIPQPITAPQFSLDFWNQSLAIAQQIGQECGERIGGDDQIGQYMSTAAVATDMKLIVEAFAQTEDGQKANSTKLNYWGFSYGTTLGMTFASMYPDMVGNMVIDANMNPDDYISGLVQDSIILTDDLYSNLFTLCSLAGPEQCAYATGNSTADIYARFERFMWHFDAEKAHKANWANASDIQQSLALLQSTFRDIAPSPAASFPSLASMLVAWEQVVATNFSYSAMAAAAAEHTPLPSTWPGQMSSRQEWGHAVFCAETDPFSYGSGDPLELSLQQYIRDAERQSVLQGGIYVHDWRLQCAYWPIRTRWRFRGPFGGKTSNGIQFVGNTFDPETPLANTQANVQRFAGSKLLTIDGLGHGSLNTKNVCGLQAVTNYFQTGQPQETYCAFEPVPWNVTGIRKLKPQPKFSLPKMTG